ncbi:MAG: SHOCT domain-containing protein [Thaumarchaeota archaeon]|nr:SHOCT domain-containing protein [Nitrososphaerota archaeon]
MVKKRGYLSKFLGTADKAIQDGIKKADETLDAGIELGIITAKQARVEAKRLRKEAEKEVAKLQKQAEVEIDKIKSRSEKKIKSKIAKLKQSSSPEENLRVLEKLGKLKKAGIISQKEFQQKKKQLLKDI